MAEPEEISFFANCKGWMAVKKKTINPDTEQKEILAVLASINDTTSRKAYEFTGIKTAEIDAYVALLVKGKRKGLGNLADIFGSLKQSELKAKLVALCPDPLMYPFAETYFINKLLRTLGYSPFIGAEAITEVYPDMKMPKPRGRKPKK
ncbi:Uncharacterised protein [uncultured archaeon]|nr:Uncharacterised protein [uncultured archaeon]